MPSDRIALARSDKPAARQNLPAVSRHGLPLGHRRQIALSEKIALYQAFVHCARHGTRLADQTARPFGRAHDRAASTDDRTEAASAAAAPTAAAAKRWRVSVAVVDDRFFFDGPRAEHGRDRNDAVDEAQQRRTRISRRATIRPRYLIWRLPNSAEPNSAHPARPALGRQSARCERRSEQSPDSGDRTPLPTLHPPIKTAATTATAPLSAPMRSTRGSSAARRSMPRSRTSRWRRCRRICSTQRIRTASGRVRRQARRRHQWQGPDRRERHPAAFDRQCRNRAGRDLAAQSPRDHAAAANADGNDDDGATPAQTADNSRDSDHQRSLDAERFATGAAESARKPHRCRSTRRFTQPRLMCLWASKLRSISNKRSPRITTKSAFS